MSSSKTSQSDHTEDDIQDQFILVLNPIKDEDIEIPLAVDGTLPITKLTFYFPGSKCLEYKNPKTGRKRFVDFDEEKKALLAPPDGWDSKSYSVVYKDNCQPGQVDWMSESVMRKYLFYIVESNGLKSCVTLLNGNYFSTFYHSPHNDYQVGQSIIVHSFDNFSYTTKVMHYSERRDFVLLKSLNKVIEGPNICDLGCTGTWIKLHGMGNCENERSFKVGCSSRMVETNESGPFMLGKIPTDLGDSGAPVFDEHGLFGMSVRLEFPDCSYKDGTINAAQFCNKNVMVLARDLIKFVNHVENQELQLKEKRLSPPDVLKRDGKEQKLF